MQRTKTQVPKEHYIQKKYDTLERFISYHYQIASVLKFEPETVLEVGVGNGFVTDYLARTGVKVTTVDFDERLMPDIVADIRHLPVPDNEYDLVMACQVLEHIPFDDFEKALGEIGRVTKRYAVISLPRRGSYMEFVLRFPFIRLLFHRNFLDFSMHKYMRFGGYEMSGQHHFEIDANNYKLRIVREKIKKHFIILKEFSPVLNKYHYFFILECKK
jgi:ubiquinone/menaquinone biosynthesis C-methylase UbiE